VTLCENAAGALYIVSVTLSSHVASRLVLIYNRMSHNTNNYTAHEHNAISYFVRGIEFSENTAATVMATGGPWATVFSSNGAVVTRRFIPSISSPTAAWLRGGWAYRRVWSSSPTAAV